jgi:hypothetical protein
VEERLAGRLVAYLDVDAASQRGRQNGWAVIRHSMHPKILEESGKAPSKANRIREPIQKLVDDTGEKVMDEYLPVLVASTGQAQPALSAQAAGATLTNR